MTWVIEVVDDEGITSIYPIDELPEDFDLMVSPRGKLYDPQKNLYLFIDGPCKCYRFDNYNCNCYKSIVSATIFKDIRFELSCDLDAIDFNIVLEDREKEKQRKEEEKKRIEERQRREEEQKQRKEKERKQIEKEKKLDWSAVCAKNSNLHCSECKTPLYRSEKDWEKRRISYKICFNCSQTPLVDERDKLIRCPGIGCENPLLRSRVTGKMFVRCSDCFQK